MPDDTIEEGGGGFLHELDRNVAPYALPKNLHVTLNPIIKDPLTPATPINVHAREDEEEYIIHSARTRENATSGFDDDSDNADLEEVIPPLEHQHTPPEQTKPNRPLKTMTEFAETNPISIVADEEKIDHRPTATEDISTRRQTRQQQKTKPAVSSTPSSSRPSRKRKRVRRRDTDSEPESNEDSDVAGTPRSSRRKSKAVSKSVPKSDRTLRSRVSTTTS